jgi:hypothetical protein
MMKMSSGLQARMPALPGLFSKKDMEKGYELSG